MASGRSMWRRRTAQGFLICIPVSGEEVAARPGEAFSHSEPLMRRFSVSIQSEVII